jgi:hypothetical protein
MTDYLHFILARIQIVFAIAAAASVIVWWNRLSRIETWAGLVVLANCSFDIVSRTLTYGKHTSDWLYNFGMLIEVSLLTYIFYETLNSKARKIIKVVYLLFIVGYVINLWFFQGFNMYNNYTFIPAQVFIAILAFRYLGQTMETLTQSPLHIFLVWFSAAIMIDYTATLPIGSAIRWLSTKPPEAADKLYDSNTVIFIIRCTVIIVGLLWTKKRPTLSSS